MTRKAWNEWREALPKSGLLDSKVVVHYHWNFGRPAQREKRYHGRLDMVRDDGVVMDLANREHKTFSYKSIDSIEREDE